MENSCNLADILYVQLRRRLIVGVSLLQLMHSLALVSGNGPALEHHGLGLRFIHATEEF